MIPSGIVCLYSQANRAAGALLVRCKFLMPFRGDFSVWMVDVLIRVREWSVLHDTSNFHDLVSQVGNYRVDGDSCKCQDSVSRSGPGAGRVWTGSGSCLHTSPCECAMDIARAGLPYVVLATNW